MKLVIQRVTKGSVEAEGAISRVIGQGLVVLLGIEQGDTLEQAHQLATKLLKIRLWPDLKDSSKQWASSVVDNGYELLVISQFTLFATFKKPKPDFHQAMGGDDAKILYEAFVKDCHAGLGNDRVATGVFGAMMHVEISNDGPVTVELVAELRSKAAPVEKVVAPISKAAPPDKVVASAATAAKAIAEQAPVPSTYAETLDATSDTSFQQPAKNLDSEEGAFEELLGTRPYLGGFRPSKKDAEYFGRLQLTGLPNTARWNAHVGSFTAHERSSWP